MSNKPGKWEYAEYGVTCTRCGGYYILDDGCDPTDYCHLCAQELVPILLRKVDRLKKKIKKIENAWGHRI